MKTSFLVLAAALLSLSACVEADAEAVVDETTDFAADESALNGAPNAARLTADGVMVMNGARLFPIGFTMGPGPDSVAPSGRAGLAELRAAGATFIRTGPMGMDWTEEAFAQEKKWQDAAAKYHLFTWLYLKDAPNVATPGGANEQLLRRIVTTFKDHPALGAWKSVDEPAALNTPFPMENLKRGTNILRSLDSKHPVVIIQAPRDTVAEIRTYNAVSDIQGTDIYPISYPPGTHGDLPNKDISVVGDYAKKMKQVVAGEANHGVWMTLQICWSGVAKEGKTLRMPTFAQERFMAYDAIIHGARGLMFFGGHMDACWAPSDFKYGWNWSFWNKTLRYLVSELGTGSALQPALVAPESTRPVRSSNPDVEFVVRETQEFLYVIAEKKGSGTETTTFTGLAPAMKRGTVLFEQSRTVDAEAGTFTDWFAPHDVHVYRFAKVP